jgi:quinol monooxygenase YgiN
MILRIVKMTFKPESVPAFLKLFELQKNHIAAFDGCVELHLLQDMHQQNVFFTQSIWHSEAHLQAYRNSSFFKEIWSKTKPHFSEKAEAWTLKYVAL